MARRQISREFKLEAIDRLRRKVTKLMAERDILKKAAVGSTGRRNNLGEHITGRSVAKSLSGPSV